MRRLNELKLQALVKAGKPVVVAVGDGSGLSLRITLTGASWQLRYWHGGKPHWFTIGKYPGVSLKEAEKQATKERARINDGVDPVAERRRSALALKGAKVFRDLAADYEARALPDVKASTRKIILQFLKRDILPRIGDLRIEEVSGGLIVQMVEQIAKRSDSAARRAFQIISVIFSHGVAKELAKSNPCASLELKAILGKRKRVRRGVSLGEDQLRTVLAALPAIRRRNALALKILLATCVRKSELQLARREHLDLEQGAWTIPSENTKNGKVLVIPLAPVVVEWFRALLALARGSAWVLPGQSPSRPLSPNGLNFAIDGLRKIEGLGDLPRFSPHDLRRTARTHLGKLGVDIITAEKCLNHTLGGLVDVYDRGDYFEERRKALALWADFLTRCEQPADKVISLRKAS